MREEKRGTGTMKIKHLLFFMACLMPLSSMAQNKQFTLEDLNFGGTNYHKMTAKNQWYAWWGDQLVRQDAEQCLLVNPVIGKETVLFTLEGVNHTFKKTDTNKDIQLHSLFDAEFPYADKPFVLLNNGKVRLLYNFKKNELEWSQPCIDENFADFNAVSRSVAFVREHQLWITLANGDSVRLTTDGSREIVYGQSVHRDEFGISKGTFWSPDGQQLAFYRMDQSMVADYPLVDIFHRTAQYVPEKYPMAGETSHKVTVGVYNLKTKRIVYLDAGDPTDRYFTNIAWDAEGKTIYMFELNRDQNDCRLVSYDAQSGKKLAELYREQNDKYVEPLHPILFLPWNHEQFILQSQRDGYNHLYLFDKMGRQIKQVTSGKWVVENVLGFDVKHRSIVIESNELKPIQKNIFTVNIDNGKRTLLDENGIGSHSGTLSASGLFVLDKYTTPDIPRNITVVRSDRKQTRLLTAANPWEGYNVPEYSCGTLKAADGVTDLYYRMVKPVGFDPAKKYPTIVYVYGGPHAHNVEASWHFGSRSWETYMAQKGYLLFILDNRGSENRGRDFEQATFRQLGQIEMQDQMRGVEYLKSLPYVDQSRMGIHGWSFGGFMTISMMTNYPDVFKAGVAGGPVIDWKWYEVMYGERYMDTPQSNPEGYAKTSLLNKAKDLKGKLEIIIGYNDNTVVPQHALSFLAACIQAGTQPDFFIYPGEPHNMRGHQSVHLHERISQYFDDYLK
jgi:dipeptidyl-peptidase-4